MSLLDTASLIVTPNGYKASKLYSVKPTSGLGDMTVVRNTTATRVNSAGLIEGVAINVPRIDYPPLGGCPSILVEPLRTNLVLRSEEFSNAFWSKFQATVIADTATAPNGTVTADLVHPASTGALTGQLFKVITTGISSGNVVTTSVFVKAAGKNFAYISPLSNFSPAAWFNLTTGAITNQIAGVTTSMTAYGNDWYKISVTSTSISSSINNIAIGSTDTAGSNTNTASGTNGILVWGAQVEIGSNETSYIPTVASTVTRNADDITKTGVSSLIGQSEGTIFWDIKDLTGTGSTGNPVFGIINSALTNWIAITTNTSGSPFRILVTTTTSNIIDFTANITLAKACVKYGTFGAKLFLNGNSTPVATSSVNPNFTFDKIDLKGSFISFKTNNFQLYTTALTDAQCISLTTP